LTSGWVMCGQLGRDGAEFDDHDARAGLEFLAQ
jgi:hypothetical protein